MKNFTAILAIVALGAISTVQSQTPKPATRSAVGVLKKISEDNAKLLQRQAESLKQLEEMEKTAKSVKIFTSRG
jgi:hypothetical protein